MIVELPRSSSPRVVPWPGTPSGGAYSEAWGESIRLFVQAGIAGGNNWHMGPGANSRLDAGNVMGHVAASGGGGNRLWVDLACSATLVDIGDGATKAAGVMSRDEAATLTLELYDPERLFDPTNTNSPYWLGGRSRLTAGTPVQVFAEVLNAAGTGVVSFTLFNGTVDRWLASVEREPGDRRTRVTATGAVKALAALDYAEAPSAVGAHDTTAQRLDRIRTYFSWTGALEQVGTASPATRQATTLATSAWELLNRTIDDELSTLHVLPDGTIRWWGRGFWTTAPTPPAFTLGCLEGVTAWDVVTDTALGAIDEQLRNAVYAARTGGTQQVAKSPSSISAHGGFESALTRTDLGLEDDAQVATWAGQVIMLFAFPTPVPQTLDMQPALGGEDDGTRWRAILDLDLVTDTFRLVWDPHDGTSTLDQQLRALGVHHEIRPSSWSMTYQLLAAKLATGNVWHIGPHARDRLNDGNILGWTHTTAPLEGVG